ncbi:MAG: response regulator [Proteobacteria bacterium]|nr:response regulator [Pseudomonadota bacterium]
MPRTVPPRILLAEDDPVSQEFLAASLRALGCEVSPVADGAHALASARAQAFDLLILDRSLPRKRGDEVLRELRADPHAASRGAMAIATTADPETALHAQLRDAGFDRVLVKPLGAAVLRRALHESGLLDEALPAKLLDDDDGIATCGNAETLASLRAMLAAELQTLQGEFDVLARDRDALRERMHRLRAACGFCGATSLQRAAAVLSDARRDDDPARLAAVERDFRRVLAATLAALPPQASA